MNHMCLVFIYCHQEEYNRTRSGYKITSTNTYTNVYLYIYIDVGPTLHYGCGVVPEREREPGREVQKEKLYLQWWYKLPDRGDGVPMIMCI